MRDSFYLFMSHGGREREREEGLKWREEKIKEKYVGYQLRGTEGCLMIEWE